MKYQVMPELLLDEYEELKADIAQRGVMIPIEFDELGNVLDGHHRLKICGELGIADYPKVIRAGMTETDKRIHARKLNMARRHLNQEQRRGLIREQLIETPELSDRQIAAGLSVNNSTVSRIREKLVKTGDVLQCDTSIDTLGREQPRVRKPIAIFNPTPREEKAIQEPAIMEKLTSGAASTIAEAMQEEPYKLMPHISHNSGNNEWYTPSEYIEAARVVMGGIDLDPASSDIANKTVKAEKYYTAEMDGLQKPWHGRIWLNPPYSGELIQQFIEKLKISVNSGEVEQATVLVNNATETVWFNTLINLATAVMFPRSRVKFYMPDGKTGAPLQGQAVIYVGSQAERFVSVFSKMGWCAYPTLEA